MRRPSARLSALLASALALTASAGCIAIYPELTTKLHSMPSGQVADPPPPDNLKWMRVLSARVPPTSRDGRAWTDLLGSLPDPYVIVFIDGVELFRTPPHADTLEPTWPDGPRGNFVVAEGSRLRVELWDSNALTDKPIGVRDFGKLSSDDVRTRQLRVELDGNAEVVLAIEPAHAMLGLGLWYELYTGGARITRLLDGGPAKRAGFEVGDELIELGTKKVKDLSSDEVRSIINSLPAAGLPVTVKHAKGTTAKITLQEGPVYPTFAEHNPLD
jgi:hypothetical protein